jgi:hypothetical protein
LTHDAIRKLKEQRRQIMAHAGILPFGACSSDKLIHVAEEGCSDKIKGKWPMTAGELFLAAKEEKELEEFARKANSGELARKVKEGGSSQEEFPKRDSDSNSFANRVKQGVSKPAQSTLFSQKVSHPI